MKALVVSTLLFLVVVMPLPAQSAGPDIELGERVRIDSTYTGTLLERRDAVLVLQPESPRGASAAPLEISLREVGQLEAWRCCSRGKGFFYGAMAGAGAALVGGLVLQSLPAGDESDANMAMAGTVLVGIPIGVVVGGLIGRSVLAPHDWVEVRIPRL